MKLFSIILIDLLCGALKADEQKGIWHPVERVKQITVTKNDSCAGYYPITKIVFLPGNKVSITQDRTDPNIFKVQVVKPGKHWRLNGMIFPTTEYITKRVDFKLVSDTLQVNTITTENEVYTQLFVNSYRGWKFTDFNETDLANLLYSGEYNMVGLHDIVSFSVNGKVRFDNSSGLNPFNFISYKFKQYKGKCDFGLWSPPADNPLDIIIEFTDQQGTKVDFQLIEKAGIFEFYRIYSMKQRWEVDKKAYAFSLIRK